MSKWEKRIDLLIDMSSTLEEKTWLNKQLKQLKIEINEEIKNRPIN